MLTLRLGKNTRIFLFSVQWEWRPVFKRWPQPDKCRFYLSAGPIEIWSYR